MVRQTMNKLNFFRKTIPGPSVEAEQAKQEADQMMEHAIKLVNKADTQTIELNKHLERNHFAERLRQSMKGNL